MAQAASQRREIAPDVVMRESTGRPRNAQQQRPAAENRDRGRNGRVDSDDLPPTRLIPPNVVRLLHDRRIDPITRAFLLGIGGRNPDTWTLHDLQMVTSVTPAITEMHIGTAALSDFYEFMGLDPTSLFNPQLGAGWQSASITFDPRQGFQRGWRCINLSRQGRVDPSSVRVRELLDCVAEHNPGAVQNTPAPYRGAP